MSPVYIQRIIAVLGIIQGSSSGVLIAFYCINKFSLVIKKRWRDYTKENYRLYDLPPNENRLEVEEMSIEHTHLILMVKGPEAEEFNAGADK